jgi:hypothetical protein
MTNEPIDILRAETIKDIIIQAYRLYKANFIKMLGIILLLKGPYLIVIYVLSKLIVPLLAISIPLNEQNIANFEYISSILIIELLDLAFVPFISPITISAITAFISKKHLGIEINISEAYRIGLKKAIPLLGTIFVSGIIICSGFVVALPALISSPQVASILSVVAPCLSGVLWVWFAFVPQTVTIEGEGGFGAMKRSKHLINGYFRKGFILIPLVFLGILIITWMSAFGFSKLLLFAGDNGSLLGKGFSNIISVLLEPFRILIIPLLYFDMRVRKEGFDKDLLQKELESEF